MGKENFILFTDSFCVFSLEDAQNEFIIEVLSSEIPP